MSLLPTSYEDELRIFVHAVIKSGQALAEQIDHTKMWARDDLLHFSAEFPKYVEHEHTRTLRLDSSHSRSPEVRVNRGNLNTGACFGGALSAAFFNGAEAKPFHMISVT